MKVHNLFKPHRILTVPGPKSKPVCLMHVVLCVVRFGVVSQSVKKYGCGMKLTPPSKKRDDFGKSGRRVEIKKSIFKQKGKQKLYTLQGKEHKETNLVILKTMINVIKSLRKLVE